MSATMRELPKYSKTWLELPLKKKTKIVLFCFSDRLSLNAGQRYCRMIQWEHYAILSTFIKLPFVNKIFVFPIFEWPLNTGFTVPDEQLYITLGIPEIEKAFNNRRTRITNR